MFTGDKMEPTRVGFLGTGWIASTYAKALVQMPQVTVAALCNHHIEKAEAFNAAHLGGGAKCFNNFKQMLAEEKLDALYICIPPGAHNGEAELAARSGIHLMLEKPIALTMARAESIAAAVKSAGVKCQIGHQMRHTLPVMKLKQMLNDGSAGRPVLLQGWFFTNALFPKWWRDPNLGGGQLVEQSIHIYDMARHLLGTPDIVTAFADNLVHQRFSDYQVDDVSAATVHFRNGAIASICAANCADPTAGSVGFNVLCEKVSVEFKFPGDAVFALHGGKVAEEITDKSAVIHERVKGSDGPYDELSRNFIAGIREGEELRSSVEDGVESLRLVLAAAESSRQKGTPQKL
jgi:predicted dehydrogenase